MPDAVAGAERGPDAGPPPGRRDRVRAEPRHALPNPDDHGPPGRPGEVRGAAAVQPRLARPEAVGDVLRRVGLGPDARPVGPVRRDRGGRRHGGNLRPQPVEPGLRQPGRVRGRVGPAAHRHGRPHRVRRSHQLAGVPQRDGPGRVGRPGRAAARPVRRGHGRRHRRAGPVGRGRVPAGPGGRPRRGAQAGPRVPHPRGVPRRARRAGRALGQGARRGHGADAQPRVGRDAQPLAADASPELPALGPVGVLPVRRRVRLPRPTPGRGRPGPRRAGRDAGANPPGRRPAVPRGRTPSTGGTRRPAAASAPSSPTTSSGWRS